MGVEDMRPVPALKGDEAQRAEPLEHRGILVV